eukprot:Hpha_TRINITY_DN15939_c1_g9::TRINITY_DN15939_c1_g9_i1::g.71710::m.71710
MEMLMAVKRGCPALRAVAAAQQSLQSRPSARRGSKVAKKRRVSENKRSLTGDPEEDRCVFVNDLSGLTKNTRKHGVCHTSAVIVRMRQLALPVFKRHGVLADAYEGDNIFALFPSVQQGVQAAYEVKALWDNWNQSLSEERKHYRIGLSGIAVAWGPASEHGGHVFGSGFDAAYHMAEDLAENGQLLIHESARELALAAYPKIGLETLEGADVVGYIVTPSEKMKQKAVEEPPVACDDARFLHANLVPFARMCDPAENLSALEADVKERFAKQNCAALMFRCSHEYSEEKIKHAIAEVRKVFAQDHGVIFCEDIGVVPQRDLFFFTTPAGGVRAAIAARKLVATLEYPDIITGWGIHVGEVLLVPGTDVHWGDPVNTASKTGQDLAGPGELLITDAVFQLVKEELADSAKFEAKTLMRSGVEFLAHAVSV